MWSAKGKCEVWSVKCEECSVKCAESLRLALPCAGVARKSCSWTTSAQQLPTKHARTHGPGWRTVNASSIDEKALIVYPKATSGPPRAGTTSIILYHMM